MGLKESLFFTVGANKNSIKIIGDHTDKYVQAYFQYDSKKTGGVTISHLRFGDSPIKSSYYINKADFVACHVPAYITKHFPIVRDVKPNGVFLINCQWSDEELSHHLDAASKRYIAKNNIQVYTINAIDLAKEIGMGKRTNTILQSAFFSLAKVMPESEAIQYRRHSLTLDSSTCCLKNSMIILPQTCGVVKCFFEISSHGIQQTFSRDSCRWL